MESGTFFYICLFIVLIVLAFFYNRGRRSIIRDKKEKYINAIKSGNRIKALETGRDYYSYIRGGELTTYDEQAIANDLSIIK